MPQFGGASEKCFSCAKTVYFNEKIVVEDKEDRRIFHKACLKCSHCQKSLSLGNYASMGGEYFCKPHFKQLFATKGNYNEGFGKEKITAKWAPTAAPATTSALSFVPVESTSEAAAVKKETPVAIASKFQKKDPAPAPVAAEKPHVAPAPAPAPVVAAEKPAPSFKETASTKAAAAKAQSQPNPQFVPVESTDAAAVKKETPAGIASRFKSQSDKCHKCGKTAYATEKIVVDDKDEKRTFHKACLKCSHCQKVLSLGNYAAMGGEYFCKPHFKQLFATKGNYNEGFGKEKLTAKWTAAAAVETSPSSSFTSSSSTTSTTSTDDHHHHRHADEESKPAASFDPAAEPEDDAPHHRDEKVHHEDEKPAVAAEPEPEPEPEEDHHRRRRDDSDDDEPAAKHDSDHEDEKEPVEFKHSDDERSGDDKADSDRDRSDDDN